MKVEISLAITLVLLALEIKNFITEGGIGKEIAYTLAKLIALSGVSLFCIFHLNMPHIVQENLDIIIRERQKQFEKNSLRKEIEERQNWRRTELPGARTNSAMYCKALRRRSLS